MRLSADRNDPGYQAFLSVRKRGDMPVVTVDGVEVQYCITADIDEGAVEAYETDVNGKVRVDFDINEIKRKTLTGRVEITFRPANDG